MAKENILSVGSIAFDTIQTPLKKAEKVLGGSLNYFSISASVFSKVSVVGVVGSDYPKANLKLLENHGINIEGIEIQKGETFHWTGEYQGAMNEAITRDTKLNVFESFMPKLNKEHSKSKYLFLANIDPKLQLHVMDQIKKTNIVACDTMNFWINSSLTTLKKVISKTDILFLNEGEVKLLTGKSNPIEGSAEVLKMGPKVMVLKRGQYGAMLFTRKSKFFVPAYPVNKVVDPTGAGDTFAGGFMGYLAANNIKISDDKGLKKAMTFGTVMASFTVEDFSIGRLKKITMKDAKTRFESLKKMMSF